MKVWLLNPHDAVPGETWGYKHGMFMAETLASAGHDVTYWASNFSHATKQFRSQGWGEIEYSEKIRILLVPVAEYKRHVGLMRLKSLFDYALGVNRRSKSESRPDCIVIAMPTPFSDFLAVRLSKRFNAHLISDFRDLWPEIFLTVFPKSLRGIAKILLYPLYWSRRYTFKNSHAIMSVCETFLKLACTISPELNGRPKAVIYSTGVNLLSFQNLMKSPEYDSELPAKNISEVWAICAGTIGNNYDFHTLFEAAVLLSADPAAENLKIIVAGDGPLRGMLVRFIEQHGLKNIKYVGILDMPRLCRYYAQSDIGLSIYAKGSTVEIPAKAFDYYAAELPIINSVVGEFAGYIKAENIGIQYEAGNPSSLADALRSLSSNPEKRESMKQRLHDIAPIFDREKQYAKLSELLPHK